jgi:hypothetical protein
MIDVTWESTPLIVLTIAVAIFGVGRLTRIIVHDDFPPAKWWREMWVRGTDGSGWQKLFICWWCLAPWLALVCILWWLLGQHVEWVQWAWWIWWGMLALGYVATMVIVRDEPADE